MSISVDINSIIEQCDGPGDAYEYHQRHGTPSLNVLTVRSTVEAMATVAPWREEIAGRRVVEVGAGVGYLALELAKHAKEVFAIEVDAGWSWAFTKYLYAAKPENLTWIFGKAETVCRFLSADVAVIRSYSGIRSMVAVAEQMAPRIIISLQQGFLAANRGDPALNAWGNLLDDRIREVIREVDFGGDASPLTGE